MRRSRTAILVIGGVLLAGCASAGQGMTTPSEEEGAPTTAPEATTTSSSITPSTTTEPQPLDPQLEEALSVATAFTQARADHDVGAMTELGIDGHIQGFLANGFDSMPGEFAWQEAVGWTIEITGCEITNAEISNTRITCHVTHTDDMSTALGQGPFDGAYHMKVMYVGDRKLLVSITKTTVTESLYYHFPQLEYTTGTWRPFVTWLEQTHPEDMDLMLGPSTLKGHEDGLVPPGDRPPLTTPESIELWRLYVQEFVTAQG